MLGNHPPEQTLLGADPLGSRHPWEQTSPREQMPPWSRHPKQTPPGADNPQEADPPGADTPQAVTPWSRHPTGADTPLEQTPPGSRHTPGADTPPPEADSGIRSMSGRYASYWNAFLLLLFLYTLCASRYVLIEASVVCYSYNRNSTTHSHF